MTSPLDGFGDDRRLVLAERQHDDLPRFENRADAHRDRPPRHVLLAEEIAGRVDPRDAVERDQPRAALLPEPGSLKPMCPVRPMPRS